MQGEAVREQAQPVPLWRNRDYLLLWGGQSVSIIGTITAGIAFPLLVLALTHSPLQAGIVGALDRIPFLLIGLPAGALIDRWNRKLVMIVCDAVRTLAFISIPLAAWTGHLSMPLIYLVAVTEGFGFAFFNLAEVAALPQVVAPPQMARASAQNNMLYALGSLLGPPIGGVLYATGRALPFLADAVSYAVSVVSLLFIRVRFQGQRTAAPGSIRSEMTDGLRWLWGQPVIRFVGILTGAQTLVFSGAPLAVIVLSQREFHASSSAIGIIFGAAAIGGIVGAVAAGELVNRLTLPQAIIGGSWMSALIFPLLAAGPNLPSLGLIAAFIFLAGPIYDVAQFTYRMRRIPDELQGRVNSVYRMILMGGQPVGQALTGALLQLLAPRAAILVMGAGGILLALVASLNGNLRREGPI